MNGITPATGICATWGVTPSPQLTGATTTRVVNDMAGKEISVPEWLIPGAEVVVWEEGRRAYDGSPEARVDTVKAVGKMWLTLADLDEKIRIDLLRSKDFGGKWSHWRYQIAERNSDEAVKMLNRTNMISARDAANSAANAWQKDVYNDDRRAELRDALDRLDDALKLFRGGVK